MYNFFECDTSYRSCITERAAISGISFLFPFLFPFKDRYNWLIHGTDLCFRRDKKNRGKENRDEGARGT